MPQPKTASDAPTRTRYGTMHPERVENELWEQAIREGWSGYHLSEHLGGERDASRFGHRFSHSSYRDTTPGPFWSWQRYGRTSTPLPDGRVIHIAGEHEDHYDADFCIYNDVVVEYPGGRREFYLYPKDVFPPTDFHTATLIGDEITLIGSLGYHDLRRPGETQVLKLDTRTLRIEPVATTGERPGWISNHIAQKLSETAILVIGGNVQTRDDYGPSTGVFELDLTTMIWRRREHGDTTVFPVSDVVYRRSKNPRYGTANPERSDNRFWLEMVRVDGRRAGRACTSGTSRRQNRNSSCQTMLRNAARTRRSSGPRKPNSGWPASVLTLHAASSCAPSTTSSGRPCGSAP